MRLLLALDGSDGSLVARDLVAGLPVPHGTETHVLSAYQVPVDWAPDLGAGMAWIGDAESEIQEALDETLNRLSAPLVAARHVVTTHVVRGRPASVIARTAAAVKADVIVTGSRGRGSLASAVLGSVATELATHAPCPVLVARKPRVTHLLVATDGSAASHAIAERLRHWGVFRGLPADVVAVSIPDSPTFELIVGLYTLGDERLAMKRRELRERHRHDAEQMASALSEIGVPATPHVRGGDPAREIIEAAREHGADLVITGSRGLGTLDRLLLGSVARNVLTHSDRSILVVREDSGEPATG